MKHIDELRSAIETGNLAEQKEAIFRLGNQGPRARPCVPILLDLIRDLSDDQKNALLGMIGYALKETGLGAYVASPYFIALLNDRQPLVRAWAIWYLENPVHFEYCTFVNQEVVINVIQLVDDHEILSPGGNQSHLLDTGWWAFCLLDRWRPDVLQRCLAINERGYDFWREATCSGNRVAEVLTGIVGLTFFPEVAIEPLSRLLEQGTAAVRETIIKSCYWLKGRGVPLLRTGLADADHAIRDVAKHILACVEGDLGLLGERKTAGKENKERPAEVFREQWDITGYGKEDRWTGSGDSFQKPL
jgi:hypothetical protein